MLKEKLNNKKTQEQKLLSEGKTKQTAQLLNIIL